ncbi:MAG TPA: protein-glutamate O-methyltransferase CheR [bacterium]|nr:protein-glutamate O-methyltransferase CheR [bacterium]
MKELEIENIEINLLLEAIFQRCGYDFRSYARASVERRIRQFLSESQCEKISEMIQLVLWDETFCSRLIQQFSISVTEMFRDPAIYLAIRRDVIPLLRTYPHIKIWHAGCATGEEAYSLAIILKEEGLFKRTTIFATDFNDSTLDRAKNGIYSIETIKEATRNYQIAGGRSSFSEYYHSKYNAAAIDASLKRRITFANHNLVTDHVFGEMHLIFCRNVLIYFNRELQNRVLKLFSESLVHGGFLCLGLKESIDFTDAVEDFEVVDKKMRIYKKKGAP